MQVNLTINAVLPLDLWYVGAGLGILRKATFQIVLIDEASQITEPCALIPLVKGARRAVMVGDLYCCTFSNHQTLTFFAQCSTTPHSQEDGRGA